MMYTVNALAKLSSTTPRTLRFYDQIGLLKPAHIAENGYRFYGEAQLLRLQQILFFREMGFELKDIKTALAQEDFDQEKALLSHKKTLLANLKRTQQLLATIDKTLEHIRGTTSISEKDFFAGFTQEFQQKIEDAWTKYLGPDGKNALAASKELMQYWTIDEVTKYLNKTYAILHKLSDAMKSGAETTSAPTQELIQEHYEHLLVTWKPTKQNYLDFCNLIAAPDQPASLDAIAPGLGTYMSVAMRFFGENSL